MLKKASRERDWHLVSGLTFLEVRKTAFTLLEGNGGIDFDKCQLVLGGKMVKSVNCRRWRACVRRVFVVLTAGGNYGGRKLLFRGCNLSHLVFNYINLKSNEIE